MTTRRGTARARQVRRIREIEATRKGGRRPATGTLAAFPVFGELQQREFDRSPWPMRIFEHGTFRFLAVNDAAVKLYGYTREEFLAMTARDTRHPEELDDFLTALDQPTGYFRHRGPRRHVKKNGEVIVVEAVTQDILFDGRKARLSMNIDVTERKQAERALHESESKYRNLVESSSDLIWSADAAGRITFINHAVRQIYGYEPAEMLGRPVGEFLGGEHRKKAFGFFRQMLAEGRSWADYECEVRHKNGQPVVLSSNAIVLRDDQGRRIGVSGISKDITARKNMESALRQSEERFRQLAENIGQVFWINTPAGDRIDYISPGYEEIWGRSRESLYCNPRSWMESIHLDDLPAVRDGLEKMARGKPTDVEYRIIRPDGTVRWIIDRSYPMTRSDGTRLVYGLAEDITGHKQAEQERLSHAVAQRDALVREVHHRIKNSLQGVAGLLRQKIRKYPAAVPDIEECIAQLQSVEQVYGLQGTRADGLLGLAEIVDVVCSSTESLFGGRVDRNLERNSPWPACIAGSEAVSVAVALNELVFNALKHQPAEPGGKCTRIVLRETADEAEIRITNRGRLPAGFDYFTGRATGNGLGLVRMLLASPGGTVTFNGAEGEVEVVLKLRPPLLAGRQKAVAG